MHDKITIELFQVDSTRQAVRIARRMGKNNECISWFLLLRPHLFVFKEKHVLYFPKDEIWRSSRCGNRNWEYVKWNSANDALWKSPRISYTWEICESNPFSLDVQTLERLIGVIWNVSFRYRYCIFLHNPLFSPHNLRNVQLPSYLKWSNS